MAMTPEQALVQIAQEIKSNLKLTEDKDTAVKRYAKRAVNQILLFCCRPDLPEPLHDVAAQIAEDMLRADGVVEPKAEVSSITRGDTGISYRDKSADYKDTAVFMKNYESQLVHFKKMKLPEDRP